MLEKGACKDVRNGRLRLKEHVTVIIPVIEWLVLSNHSYIDQPSGGTRYARRASATLPISPRSCIMHLPWPHLSMVRMKEGYKFDFTVVSDLVGYRLPRQLGNNPWGSGESQKHPKQMIAS